MTKRIALKLAAIRGIDRAYSKLPKLQCKGLCQAYCGVVPMSTVEWDRIISRLGYTPQGLTTLSCPMLTNEGRCSVYDIRPAICRLWGVVRAMTCPHKCEPERWMTDEEAFAFLAKIERTAQSCRR